ncbi:hypothetical protein HOD75_00860 [archaeon]|jgi:hypothetical protein|nr:hypothetical protein [archaeon]MBT4241427.1 hypothetical protein [archaeon]MBT4417702.1 hypothetical protein [archaeon]
MEEDVIEEIEEGLEEDNGISSEESELVENADDEGISEPSSEGTEDALENMIENRGSYPRRVSSVSNVSLEQSENVPVAQQGEVSSPSASNVANRDDVDYASAESYVPRPQPASAPVLKSDFSSTPQQFNRGMVGGNEGVGGFKSPYPEANIEDEKYESVKGAGSDKRRRL